MQANGQQQNMPARRRAFSLAELMIAVVILGVGLLIVASMFPVAWTKAREQVEATNIANTLVSAKTITAPKLRVAKQVGIWTGEDSAFDALSQSSFLGDIGVFKNATFDGSTLPRKGSDTAVHPLNMKNMVASPDLYLAGFGGVEGMPEATGDVFVSENPHRLETVAAPFSFRAPPPQVRFEDRLLPPIPRRLRLGAASPTPDEEGILTDWVEQLRRRRYCWALLARLNNGDEWSTDLVQEGVSYDDENTFDEPRFVTFYYVTLRRTHGRQRFPQQACCPIGDNLWPVHQSASSYASQVATPAAWPALADTIFPTPWRVQVYVPFPSDEPSGLPAEVEVNTANVPTGPIVTKMLPRGAYMIDELNGSVYKVVRRRLVNDDTGAILTLDSEITVADLTLPERPYDDDRDRLRTVWVYPPAVELQRDADDQPIFEGANPVVGIEVRTEVLSPQ
jgi:prepilin-type N-terminal cleavage/methylation domain-containing protein